MSERCFKGRLGGLSSLCKRVASISVDPVSSTCSN